MAPKPQKTKPFSSIANGYACPSPEDMSENAVYSVTINPSDDYQYWNCDDRFRKFLDKFYGMIKECKHAQYTLYPEMSAKGRLHFHGTVVIFNIFRFFLEDLSVLRLFSQYEIDTITERAVWDRYCTKGKTLVLPYIPKNFSYPILYYNAVWYNRYKPNNLAEHRSVAKDSKKSTAEPRSDAPQDRGANDENSECSDTSEDFSPTPPKLIFKDW